MPDDEPSPLHDAPSDEFVRALERTRTNALVAQDVELARTLHAPEYQLITPGGRSFARDDYLSDIAAGTLRYVKWEAGPMQVRATPTMAVVRYEARLEFASGKAITCWHTDFFERRSGLWLAVWSQATALAADTTAARISGTEVATANPGPRAAAVTLRVAGESDALCIAMLGTQVFLETYAPTGIRPVIAQEAAEHFSTDAITARIAHPAGIFVVAESSGHMIGFAQLKIGSAHEMVEAKDQAELERLYVLERFTGKGIGVTLLRHAEELATSRGASTMWLTAWVGNLRALGFYARQQYKNVGSTPYVFQDETFENRVFVKPLRSPGVK